MAQRRGYAMLIWGGDADIGGALRDGIISGNAECRTQNVELASCRDGHLRVGESGDQEIAPTAGRFDGSECADMARTAELVRVAVGRGLSADDYRELIFEAEMAYGESLTVPGVLAKVGEGLTMAVAVIVMAFDRLFREVGTG